MAFLCQRYVIRTLNRRMSPRYMNVVSLLCLVGITALLILQLQSRETGLKYDDIRRPGELTDEMADQTKVPVQKEDVGTGPLSFVRERGFLEDLSRLNLDELSDEQLLMTIHSNFDSVDILCRRKFRMGNIGDGGWEICDDPDVRPRDPCIIYSFGINNDFSFDDDAAAMYGCHVYSFDPSMLKQKDQFDRSSNVHFYKIGLDGRTYVNNLNWTLHTFQDIRRKLGHENKRIDIVKMDIESSEWPAIPEMLATGQLSGVKQFLVEYHVKLQSRDYVLPKLKMIQQLEGTGLKKFYVHKNPACKMKISGMPIIRTYCYEIHYLRR